MVLASPRPEAARRTALPLRQWEWCFVLSLVALCLLLRVVNPNALPIFVDEADSARSAATIGAAPGPQTWLTSMHLGVYPLFPWLIAPLTRIIADPLLAARWTSALVGTVGLAAVWATGRMLWGTASGLLAALLYALSPFILFHNRLAVPDSLVATCGAAALFFAIRLSRCPTNRDALGLSICLAGGLLTKIFAASMLLLPLLAIVAASPSIRNGVRRRALVAIVMGVLPLCWLLLTPESLEHRVQVQTRMVSLAEVPGILLTQFETLIAGLWLMVTPPILILALIGLWSMRRDREILLLGPWALMSGVLRALAPVSYITPRHFLYAAVPILLLAARGVLELAGILHRHVPRISAWLALAICMGAGLFPSITADAAIMVNPDATPLVAFDRWQYVAGWPSGFALRRVLIYLHHEASRRQIAVAMLAWYPTISPAAMMLDREHGLVQRFEDEEGLRTFARHGIADRDSFVLTFYRADLAVPPSVHGLRRVLHAPNADGNSGYNLYAVPARH